MNLRRWLTPGIGVKRWLLVGFIGLTLLAVGLAHLIRQLGANLDPSGPLAGLVGVVTLQFLPYELRGAVVALIGGLLAVIGARGVVRAFTDPLRSADPSQPLVELMYQRRALARGPRIVAIGGGTGLSILLRGLKERTSHLTAIVTVADDGGSSGVLRDQLGIPAVGDIRNCIVALADTEPLMQELLQYRFPTTGDEDPGNPGLGGHPVGNLLIAAMTAVEGGDFEEGVRHVNRILAVRGQVLPASATPLTLHASLGDGSVVDGQSQIMRTAGIDHVWLTPADVRPSGDALAAIGEADLIVLGPGSLYTSLLPSLLIPGIRDAILIASAPTVFVCNVATQEGETAGFDLAAHVEALIAHTAPGLVDVVVANSRLDARTPAAWTAETVRLRWPPTVDPVPELVLREVVDPDNAHHHDPERLADAIIGVLDLPPVVARHAVGRTA
jgi:uncharacterized cofD-like protein